MIYCYSDVIYVYICIDITCMICTSSSVHACSAWTFASLKDQAQSLATSDEPNERACPPAACFPSLINQINVIHAAFCLLQLAPPGEFMRLRTQDNLGVSRPVYAAQILYLLITRTYIHYNTFRKKVDGRT